MTKELKTTYHPQKTGPVLWILLAREKKKLFAFDIKSTLSYLVLTISIGNIRIG
jgi:hypothetical protein